MDRGYLVEDWPGSAYQMWSKNYCYRNQWRVSHTIGEFEDCLAECALQYALCRKRYGAVVNNCRHFMRLFQLMVVTTFHTYSVKDTVKREGTIKLSTKEPLIETDAFLLIKLRSASPNLKRIICALSKEPQDLFDKIKTENVVNPRALFFSSMVKHLGIKTSPETLENELHELLS